MKPIVDSETGRIAPVYLVPLGIALLVTAGTQLLPETDVFDFVRGLATGILAVIAVFTVVGLASARRRALWRAETRTLDDLEPLGPGSASRRTDRGASTTVKPNTEQDTTGTDSTDGREGAAR
jgi:hypothetical protein